MNRIFRSPLVVSQIISITAKRTALECANRPFSSCGLCSRKALYDGNRTINQQKQNGVLIYNVNSHLHTSSFLRSNTTDDSDDIKQQGSEKKIPENEGDKTDSVIERIRRLSMTSAEDYRRSPMAQKKADEMALTRKEMINNGEQWRWDQRNVRPSGAPPPRQHQGYQQRMNDWRDEDEDDGGNRRNRYRDEEPREDFYGRPVRDWRRREPQEDHNYGRSYNSRSDGQNSSYGTFGRANTARSQEPDEDSEGPEDYEVELQKLRERLNKNKANKSSEGQNKSGEDLELSERSLENAKVSSHRHEFSSTNASASFNQHSVNPDAVMHKNWSPTSVEMESNYEHYEASHEDQINMELAATNPDSFGTLTIGKSIVKDSVGLALQKELTEEAKGLSINEEEEDDDTRYIPPHGERWSNQKLIKTVRDLLKEKKLKEAVDTYMGVLTQGGFQFDHEELRHHFNVLINECANVGYVEMAFRLFNLMKKRGYKENHRTISSLLNACANSPWDKENNIDRIERLIINMQDRSIEANIINYHALIKAYARLGEIVRAFSVVDQMIQEAKIKPTTTTFNMLLQACITDTENGFRHALITWRKLRSMKLKPDIYTFNLLLRAVRDCGIKIHPAYLGSTMQINQYENVPLLPPVVTDEDSNRLLGFLCVENPSPGNETQLVLDNLGEPSVVNPKTLMKALSYPQNRLSVLGGLRGVISQMVRSKVGPNLKTITGLLQVSQAAEIPDILQLMKTYKIKPDLTFFNMAMKRCYDDNIDSFGKEILKLLPSYNLTPNIVTWGVLGHGCRQWHDAKSLLAEMEEAKFVPNFIVMGSLQVAAMKSYDPKYVLHVMEEIRKREIPLSKEIILNLEGFYKSMQESLVKKEMGKLVQPARLAEALDKNENFAEHFALFKMRYPSWLKSVEVKVYPENPWKDGFETFRKYNKHTSPQSETEKSDDEWDLILQTTKSR